MCFLSSFLVTRYKILVRIIGSSSNINVLCQVLKPATTTDHGKVGNLKGETTKIIDWRTQGCLKCKKLHASSVMPVNCEEDTEQPYNCTPPNQLRVPFHFTKNTALVGTFWQGKSSAGGFLTCTYTHKQTLWPWLRILGPNHYSCLCLCWVLEEQASGTAWHTGVPGWWHPL